MQLEGYVGQETNTNTEEHAHDHADLPFQTKFICTCYSILKWVWLEYIRVECTQFSVIDLMPISQEWIDRYYL